MPRPQTLSKTRRAITLVASVWLGTISGCAQCGSGPSGGVAGGDTWVVTIDPANRSATQLDTDALPRVLAALAGREGIVPGGALVDEGGAHIVIGGSINPTELAGSLSTATGLQVRVTPYAPPGTGRRFLIADVDRGVLETQGLTLDAVSSAVAAAGSRPNTVAALGAIALGEGADGPLTLANAGRVREEIQVFRPWTHVVRVRATDPNAIASTASTVELALRANDPTTQFITLPQRRPTLDAQVDDGRAQARGLDPAVVARTARALLSHVVVLDGAVPIVVRADAFNGADARNLPIETPDGMTIQLQEVANVIEGAGSLPILHDGRGAPLALVVVANGSEERLRAILGTLPLTPGALIEVVARTALTPAEQAFVTHAVSQNTAASLADAPPTGPNVPVTPTGNSLTPVAPLG